jgi:Heparinase II/III-like protein/Domain of unknown function (DUF4962)
MRFREISSMLKQFATAPLMILMIASLVAAIRARAAVGEQSAYPPHTSLEEIQRRIQTSPPDHPRLFATREQLTGLPKTLDRDPLRRQLADAIIAAANRLQDVPPIERKLIGRRLLDKSRTCVDRVTTLAMAYYLTGDVKHVERCRQEMLAAARFSDWHPQHFLDTAEMTFALALGYDWLYDQLDEASRNEIRNAIVQKGVRLPFDSKEYGWVHAENNWGQVCHGGITIGALAVMEDEPDLAAFTVHNALQNVPRSVAALAPNGSYPEGPGYWAYGTSYNVLLIGALETALGTDFGLAQAPGFSETGAYPALVCGPSGLFFNYADGSSSRGLQPLRFWFAARYHRPDWLRDERELWQRSLAKTSVRSRSGLGRLVPLSLLWMEPQGTAATGRLPLNWLGGGRVPIAIHRSSWDDKDAVFIGLKAGSPASNHGHMDIGSFVLDSDGVRWATDLGSEGYNEIESRGMNLWNRGQNSDRWTIFRLSNFSHNTLVIDDQLQVANGDAPIIKFSDDPVLPFSIVDMSPVYQRQVTSAKRGVALLPSREVLIQDELTGLRPGSRVRWGMVTRGEPRGLGEHKLVLRQGDKQLTLTTVGPPSVEWNQIETAKPPHEWDSPNPGTRMVMFEATAPESGKLTLAVVATPGSCALPKAAEITPEPLSEWRNPVVGHSNLERASRNCDAGRCGDALVRSTVVRQLYADR